MRHDPGFTTNVHIPACPQALRCMSVFELASLEKGLRDRPPTPFRPQDAGFPLSFSVKKDRVRNIRLRAKVPIYRLSSTCYPSFVRCCILHQFRFPLRVGSDLSKWGPKGGQPWSVALVAPRVHGHHPGSGMNRIPKSCQALNIEFRRNHRPLILWIQFEHLGLSTFVIHPPHRRLQTCACPVAQALGAG